MTDKELVKLEDVWVHYDGVPILDPVMCGVKMAENLIDLRKLGVSTSRHFMYKPPLPEDYEKERKTFGFA